MPQEGNIITTDNSINYNNLDFYKLYSFGIHASDVSGNTEYLGTVYQAFVPNDPIEEDIVFTNQLQVDSFIDGAITKIIGDLTIGASNCVGMGEVSSKIHNLEALSGLEEITGNLVIEGEYCDFITFSGLESLTNVGGDLVLNGVTSVGDLTINSPNLSSITALNNATTISNINLVNILSLNGFGQIALTGNLSINNINQTASNTFSQLRIVDELEILGLTPNNLNFVNNLEEINTSINIIGTSEIQTLNFTTVDSSNPLKITIQNNSSLLSIIGLNNTTQLKLATISSNSQLTTIAFLTSLAEITESSLEIIDNDQLTNLDALSNLNYIECPGQLIVTDNFNLGDLCGLQTLFTNNGLCSFKATIENNGYNPTPLQIENGDCSL
ncbi:hypothetical protein [Patiriisocius marinus]|uniref:hypothetical protein n=1 Tax=Patiriisocius marinus TaxID=1397112 RepID=UPI00232B52B4|nr:hypothetical protein [Patiriisocius marinus]